MAFTPFDDSPFTVGNAPFDIVAADFNDDGYEDLATANVADDTVTILLSDGEGGLAEATGSPIVVGDGPTGLAAQDFNGDGDYDLAVTNINDDTVIILIGLGDGQFLQGLGSPYTVGDAPNRITYGDFNGNGTVDLATVNLNSNDVTVLLGNEDGTFTEEATTSPIAVGTSPRDIVAADFNDDGDLDLATTDLVDDTVTILLGDGSGAFAEEATESPITVGNAPHGIAAADLDGDGVMDLVVTNIDDENVTILLSDGDGTFTEATGSPFSLNNAGAQPLDVIIEDLNNDGYYDLATANNITDDVSILLGAGDGTFTVSDVSPITVGDVPSSLVATDLDGDGIPDIATGDRNSDSVTVLRNVPITATIEDIEVIEGDDGTTNAVFTVTLSETPSDPVTIEYMTLDPPADPPPGPPYYATADEDFTPVSGTLTFDGTDEQTITVPILGDTELEPHEILGVMLSNPIGAQVLLPEEPAIATILNDDAEIMFPDYATYEGDLGETTDFTFTVSIPYATVNTVTVDYATMMGSATEGVDYNDTSGTATIDPGMTSTTITVQVIGDDEMEPDETFYVQLSDPTGASIAEGSESATGTIWDDESTIMLGWSMLTVEEGEDAYLTITRTGMGALNRPASVMLAVDSGPEDSATAGEDYSPIMSSLTFSPFETIKQIAINVIDDDSIEPSETFSVTLSDFNGAEPGMPTSAEVTIAASTARFLPVMPNPRRTPVSSVDVEFSDAISPSSFTTSDLTLTRDGLPVPLPTGVTISPVEMTMRPTYRISGLSSSTGSSGDYSLSLNLSGITDSSGTSGSGTVSSMFTVRSGLLPGDYDGDGIVDLAVFQSGRTTGQDRFFVRLSSRIGQSDEQRVFEMGTSGAIPLVGDFDGDGISDPAVADPNAILGGATLPNATVWTYLASSSGYSAVSLPFGAAGILDRPAPADYDGDGITDIATLRPDSDLIPGAAEWFIRPSTNINDGFRVQFGAAGGADLPVPADYDGDGVDDIASYRPDSDLVPGAAQWFVLPSAPNLPRYENALNAFPVTFGDAGDLALPTDFNGDGRADLGAYRSSSNLSPGNAQWFILPSEGLSPNFGSAFPTTFGTSGMIAAPGDYEGDSGSELAAFDPSTGTWMIRPVSLPEGESPTTITFGPTGPGVVPVLAPLLDRLDASGNRPDTGPDSGPMTSAAPQQAGRSLQSLVSLASFDATSRVDRTARVDTHRGRLVDAALDDLGSFDS